MDTKTLYRFFESLAYYVECKYFSERDNLEFVSPIPCLIKMMDSEKISWFNQNVLLHFWNNWETNYKKCLSTSYAVIFQVEIKPKLRGV